MRPPSSHPGLPLLSSDLGSVRRWSVYRQPSPPARVSCRYTYVPDMQVPLVSGAQTSASRATPAPACKNLTGALCCVQTDRGKQQASHAGDCIRQVMDADQAPFSLFFYTRCAPLLACCGGRPHSRPSPFQHTDTVAICAQMRQCRITWCAEALLRMCGCVKISCMGWRVHGVGAA